MQQLSSSDHRNYEHLKCSIWIPEFQWFLSNLRVNPGFLVTSLIELDTTTLWVTITKIPQVLTLELKWKSLVPIICPLVVTATHSILLIASEPEMCELVQSSEVKVIFLISQLRSSFAISNTWTLSEMHLLLTLFELAKHSNSNLELMISGQYWQHCESYVAVEHAGCILRLVCSSVW